MEPPYKKNYNMIMQFMFISTKVDTIISIISCVNPIGTDKYEYTRKYYNLKRKYKKVKIWGGEGES